MDAAGGVWMQFLGGVETSGLGTRSLVAWVMAGTGPLVMRQPTDAFGSIFLSFVLALFALGVCALFPCPCIWQSLFWASGVAEEYGKLDFSGDDFFRGGNT